MRRKLRSLILALRQVTCCEELTIRLNEVKPAEEIKKIPSCGFLCTACRPDTKMLAETRSLVIDGLNPGGW